MKIQFNTDKTINGDEKHQLHFTNLIENSLKRFQSNISRLEVHLSDKNGKKDGFNNMLCLIEARIEGKQPIAVSCQANTIEEAVSGSIEKLKSSLNTIIGRLNNH